MIPVNILTAVRWDIILPFTTLVGMAWRVGVVVVRHTREISAQLVPNGGASLRDAINRIEKATTFGERRARLLYDVTDTAKGWFEVGANGECLFVSNSWCRMTTMQRDEALGTGWVNSIARNHREAMSESWTDAIDGRRSLDTQFLGTQGVEFHIHAERVGDTKGDMVGYIGFIEVVPRHRPVASAISEAA